MIRGEASPLYFYAWNLDDQEPQISDAASFAPQLSLDGGAYGNLIDDTVHEAGNGSYFVNLAATETDCGIGVLSVTSSTSKVYVVAVQFAPTPVAPDVPTASEVATAIWTDTTSGDFEVADSPGKVLLDRLDAAISSRSTFDSENDSVTVGEISDKEGYKLASDGLDAVATEIEAGAATSIVGQLGQIWARLFHKNVKNATNGSFTTYLADDTTPMLASTWTDDGFGTESTTRAV